jgi:hypothetical protein
MFLDLILGWAVIAFPFILAILFLFIPAKSEDEKRHMRWRYALIGMGVVFSLLAWLQQSRAMRAAKEDRDDAIGKTSERVTKDVTQAVGDQY